MILVIIAGSKHHLMLEFENATAPNLSPDMVDYISNMDPNTAPTHHSEQAILGPTNTLNVGNDIPDVLKFPHIQLFTHTLTLFRCLPQISKQNLW